MKNRIAGAALLSAWASDVLAELPRPPLPSDVTNNQDMFQIGRALFREGSLIIGLIIAVVVLLVVGWAVVSDYNDVRAGRKTWSAVGLTAGIGVGIFIFVSYLLGQAAGIF